MVDLSKPVTTRDGAPARVLCTDVRGAGAYPVIALIEAVSGEGEVCITFTLEGRQFQSHETGADLINPKKKLYFLVWDNRNRGDYTSVSYKSESARLESICICNKQGWKVYKTFEIEVD